MFEDKKERREVFKGVSLTPSEAQALKEAANKEAVCESVIIRRGLFEILGKGK